MRNEFFERMIWLLAIVWARYWKTRGILLDRQNLVNEISVGNILFFIEMERTNESNRIEIWSSVTSFVLKSCIFFSVMENETLNIPKEMDKRTRREFTSRAKKRIHRKFSHTITWHECINFENTFTSFRFEFRVSIRDQSVIILLAFLRIESKVLRQQNVNKPDILGRSHHIQLSQTGLNIK